MDISSYNYFFIFSPSLFFPYPYVNNIPKKGNQGQKHPKNGERRDLDFSLKGFYFFLKGK